MYGKLGYCNPDIKKRICVLILAQGICCKVLGKLYRKKLFTRYSTNTVSTFWKKRI